MAPVIDSIYENKRIEVEEVSDSNEALAVLEMENHARKMDECRANVNDKCTGVYPDGSEPSGQTYCCPEQGFECTLLKGAKSGDSKRCIGGGPTSTFVTGECKGYMEECDHKRPPRRKIKGKPEGYLVRVEGSRIDRGEYCCEGFVCFGNEKGELYLSEFGDFDDPSDSSREYTDKYRCVKDPNYNPNATDTKSAGANDKSKDSSKDSKDSSSKSEESKSGDISAFITVAIIVVLVVMF